MKQILPLLVLLCAFSSCRSSKPILTSEPVVLSNSDSVRVEYMEIVTIDTVKVIVKVPLESAQQTVRDSTSHLETDFAESDAWINQDGTLGHSIRNKDKSISADVTVPNSSTEKNTIRIIEKEVPVSVPTPVYIERDFSNWELFRLNVFWYLVGILIIGVGWIFRKSIFSIIRKCFL